MDAVLGFVVLLLGALALVGAGYWLGRVWPARRSRPAALHPAWRQTRPMDFRKRAPPLPARPDAVNRLQDEIDRRVQALRRAREDAEPWRPPIVDAVELPDHMVWFADTAVEPHVPSRAR